MALEKMYKGIPFSPTATLTANISATDTIIPVSDVDAFPDAPSIATIGSIAGPNETIIYTGKTTTSLTGCTRGVEGVASDWMTDELIGRNFTAKDHADMVKNIEELENSKLDATYKVDVVNTADVSVGGKALDARQNNPNIIGTLAQKVANNTQQINDCLKKNTNNDGRLISNLWATFVGTGSGKAAISSNLYINSGKYYFENDHSVGTGMILETSIFDDYFKIGKATNTAVKDAEAIIEWYQVATTKNIITQLTPLNRFSITANNICRITDLGNGSAWLELELIASVDIASGTIAVILPVGLRTKNPFQPISWRVSEKTIGGYAYLDGRIVLNSAITANTTVTLTTLIIIN